MKTVLLALAAMAASGCYTQRELQAEMVNAELIKIDTIQRYYYTVPQKQKQLTWRDSYNMEYITIVPMQDYYLVGERMTMLKPR